MRTDMGMRFMLPPPPPGFHALHKAITTKQKEVMKRYDRKKDGFGRKIEKAQEIAKDALRPAMEPNAGIGNFKRSLARLAGQVANAHARISAIKTRVEAVEDLTADEAGGRIKKVIKTLLSAAMLITAAEAKAASSASSISERVNNTSANLQFVANAGGDAIGHWLVTSATTNANGTKAASYVAPAGKLVTLRQIQGAGGAALTATATSWTADGVLTLKAAAAAATPAITIDTANTCSFVDIYELNEMILAVDLTTGAVTAGIEAWMSDSDAIPEWLRMASPAIARLLAGYVGTQGSLLG